MLLSVRFRTILVASVFYWSFFAPSTSNSQVIAQGTSVNNSAILSKIKLSAKRTVLLDQINDLRASKSLKRISLDVKLGNAAQFMAEDLAKGDYLAHVTNCGLDISARVALFGRRQFLVLRENIAAGNSSISKTMNQWISSPSHYSNLIAPDITTCGIGYAKGPKSKYIHYWVLDLGDFPK